MKLKLDYDFGDTLYIKNDPEQIPRTLVTVTLRPGNTCFTLSYLGELLEVYDFQVSNTVNMEVKLGLNNMKKEEE